MKKIIFFLLTVALMTVTFSSCSGVSVEADEEAALVDKPFFFGHGGVRDDAVETGFKWVWVSTDAVRFKIVPVKHGKGRVVKHRRMDTAYDKYHVYRKNIWQGGG